MITFRQLMETASHSPVDLSFLKSKMTPYSHGPDHQGYTDKTGKANVSHKELHTKAKDAGYRYVHKSTQKVGGHDTTYHSYTKSGGPYVDHNLTVATRGNNVWAVEHKTNKDRT